jgi:light-regulated signal transduction histidine kinase (bacteriophytochrome)
MMDSACLQKQLAEAQGDIRLLQEELGKTNSELMQLTVELEDRVASRTAELQETNDRLEAEVTERKRIEEILARHNEELKRSNEELEQFAYVVSHDLQEPLRSITGFVQLLARRNREAKDEKSEHYTERIVAGVGRMRELIADLLKYSRVSTRGNPFEPVDCTELLKKVLDSLQAAFEESGAMICCGLLPTVRADGSQLGQLFQNLIGNAVKFCDESAPQIHIGAEKRDGAWVFSVRDNGIGIEPQDQERIFGVFQRLHTREEYEGTGIGLAVCKKIAERHGGRIWVESIPGEGAIFSFTIKDREEEKA